VFILVYFPVLVNCIKENLASLIENRYSAIGSSRPRLRRQKVTDTFDKKAIVGDDVNRKIRFDQHVGHFRSG
jgi:hypothetical protein